MVPLSCACCDQCILQLLIFFTELGSKWLIFISVGLPFLSVIVLMKILSGQGIAEVLALTVLYLFSLTLAYLINFFLISVLVFQPLCLKIFGVPIYSRLP